MNKEKKKILFFLGLNDCHKGRAGERDREAARESEAIPTWQKINFG